MFRHGSIKTFLVSVLMVTVFLMGTATHAARKDPGLPGNHLTI